MIFKNKKEIEIPSFAHVNSADARVFTIYRDARNQRQRTTIGKATSKHTMHPNENFKFFYPVLWKQYYGGEELPPHELHAGLYGLLLSCAWRTGLYPLLQNDFGPHNANALLDYVMYSIRYRSNSTNLMEDELKDQLTFSDKLKSDSWYSDFFAKELSSDLVHKFRMDWAGHYAELEDSEAWLCIDGSNNDCYVAESDLAAPGKARSLKAINIYSYMWAVSSKDGRPITWFLNNGGMIDAKAFEKMITFLKASGIAVKGVILDRGFATEDVFALIRKLGYHYVVMLRSSSFAFRMMLEQHAEAIRWKVAHVINDKGLFGVTERTRVFAKGNEEACVGLFYDGVRGDRKAIDDIARVFQAEKAIKAQIDEGKARSALRIPEGMDRFLTLTGSEESPRVERCNETLQRTIDGRGFSAIASSEDRGALEISAVYDFRDVSEKQFSVLKSQLASDVTRVHDDQRINAKLAVSFIAAIIRTELEITCRRLGFDTNKMLREADRTVLTLMPGEQYHAVHDCSRRMKRLYAEFGLTDEHMDCFAREVNNRRNPIHSQTREMPPFMAPKPKRGPGRPPKPKTAETPKRRPGRPKGSKNKKTLEREAMAANTPPQPKRGRGRPKGVKNRKTIEREAMAANTPDKQPRAGTSEGRREQTTVEREAMETNTSPTPKRGRGRPKGVKNRKTIEREAMAANTPDRQPRAGASEGWRGQKTVEREAMEEKALENQHQGSS